MNYHEYRALGVDPFNAHIWANETVAFVSKLEKLNEPVPRSITSRYQM